MRKTVSELTTENEKLADDAEGKISFLAFLYQLLLDSKQSLNVKRNGTRKRGKDKNTPSGRISWGGGADHSIGSADISKRERAWEVGDSASPFGPGRGSQLRNYSDTLTRASFNQAAVSTSNAERGSRDSFVSSVRLLEPQYTNSQQASNTSFSNLIYSSDHHIGYTLSTKDWLQAQRGISQKVYDSLSGTQLVGQILEDLKHAISYGFSFENDKTMVNRAAKLTQDQISTVKSSDMKTNNMSADILGVLQLLDSTEAMDFSSMSQRKGYTKNDRTPGLSRQTRAGIKNNRNTHSAGAVYATRENSIFGGSGRDQITSNDPAGAEAGFNSGMYSILSSAGGSNITSQADRMAFLSRVIAKDYILDRALTSNVVKDVAAKHLNKSTVESMTKDVNTMLSTLIGDVNVGASIQSTTTKSSRSKARSSSSTAMADHVTMSESGVPIRIFDTEKSSDYITGQQLFIDSMHKNTDNQKILNSDSFVAYSKSFSNSTKAATEIIMKIISGDGSVYSGKHLESVFKNLSAWMESSGLTSGRATNSTLAHLAMLQAASDNSEIGFYLLKYIIASNSSQAARKATRRRKTNRNEKSQGNKAKSGVDLEKIVNKITELMENYISGQNKDSRKETESFSRKRSKNSNNDIMGSAAGSNVNRDIIMGNQLGVQTTRVKMSRPRRDSQRTLILPETGNQRESSYKSVNLVSYTGGLREKTGKNPNDPTDSIFGASLLTSPGLSKDTIFDAVVQSVSDFESEIDAGFNLSPLSDGYDQFTSKAGGLGYASRIAATFEIFKILTSQVIPVMTVVSESASVSSSSSSSRKSVNVIYDTDVAYAAMNALKRADINTEISDVSFNNSKNQATKVSQESNLKKREKAYNNIRSFMSRAELKVVQEDIDVINSLDIMNQISSDVSTSATRVSSGLINASGVTGFVYDIIDWLTNTDIGMSMLSSLCVEQLTGRSLRFWKLAVPSGWSPHLPSGKVINPGQAANLSAFLKSGSRDELYGGSRRKIFAVGIPDCGIQYLREMGAIEHPGVPSWEYCNIVKIKLYRRNMVSNVVETIPITKTYHTSWDIVEGFPLSSGADTKAAVDSVWDTVIENTNIWWMSWYGIYPELTLKGSDVIGHGSGRDRIVIDLLSAMRSLGLSGPDIFVNHLESYYWKMYINLAMGVDLLEDVFQFDEGATLYEGPDIDKREEYMNFCAAVGKEYADRYTNVESSLAFDRICDDISRSNIFSSGKYFNRILSATLMDRVYCFDVDPDLWTKVEEFEDTGVKSSGIKAKVAVINELVDRADNREPSYYDFWATVSLVYAPLNSAMPSRDSVEDLL